MTDNATTAETVNSITNTIAVNTVLATPSITVSDPILDSGQTLTISSYETGGTLPYTTYNFIIFNSISNTVLANQLSTSNSFSFTTNSQWITNSPIEANVIVTDSATTPAFANSVLSNAINVATPLSTPTITQSNTLLDSGQYETLTAGSVTGGSSPYTINFFNVTGGSELQIFGYQQWLGANAYPFETFEPPSCSTYSNNIYCISYNGVVSSEQTYYAPIFSDGIVGSWILTNTYALSSLFVPDCVTSSNNIYCIGGKAYRNIVIASVYSAPIFSSGAVGTWTNENSYPVNTYDQSCVTNSNNIYCITGGNSISNFQSVYYAPIFSSGVLGSWTSENAYPIITNEQSCATYSNNIYCVGGNNALTKNAVYYAPIFSSGAVGSWQATNAYPTNIEVQSCVTNSNNIYCTAGFNPTIGLQTEVDYSAPIFSSGAVGSWTGTTSYPTNTDYQSCVTSLNNIYCVAGINQTSATNAVYYAPLSAQGIANTLNYTFQTNSPTNSNNFMYNVIVGRFHICRSEFDHEHNNSKHRSCNSVNCSFKYHTRFRTNTNDLVIRDRRNTDIHLQLHYIQLNIEHGIGKPA